MAPSLRDRLAHAWNVFADQKSNEPNAPFMGYGEGVSMRPDRVRSFGGNEKSIINTIYTRISVDVSQVDIRHVRLDHNDRYMETIYSGLNNCLVLEANLDQ